MTMWDNTDKDAGYADMLFDGVVAAAVAVIVVTVAVIGWSLL